MPHVVLRFYGRFVFAEAFDDALSRHELDVLSVNMRFNPNVPADPHRVVVTAIRELVRPEPATTRLPDLMVMAAIDDVRAEHAVWNLEGMSVDVQKGRKFEWQDKTMLADLHDFTGEVPIAPTALRPSGDGPVNALIHVPDGSAVANQLVPSIVEMVPLKNHNAPVGPQRNLADKVDVTVVLPADAPTLTLRLTALDGSSAGKIVVVAEGEIPTIVTFSNLCARPTQALDEEFAGLYEVLTQPPPVPDRLVPKGKNTFTGTRDCYTPAYVSFQATR